MNNIDKTRKYSIIIKEREKTEEKKMAARIWKKVLFFILIVACLFNIISKLVKKIPFKQELETSAQYVVEQENEKK